MKNLIIAIFATLILFTSCNKKDDPKPIVTGPTPVIPANYHTTLWYDTTTSNDVATCRANGTIQNWQYNQQFTLVIVERDGTDSILVGAIVSGGIDFEWDTLKFIGDSIVFLTANDSLYDPGATNHYQAGRYTIKRNVAGYPSTMYRMDGIQGYYGMPVSNYTLDLKLQPQVYKECKQWLTPADSVTFSKYFE